MLTQYVFALWKLISISWERRHLFMWPQNIKITFNSVEIFLIRSPYSNLSLIFSIITFKVICFLGPSFNLGYHTEFGCRVPFLWNSSSVFHCLLWTTNFWRVHVLLCRIPFNMGLSEVSWWLHSGYHFLWNGHHGGKIMTCTGTALLHPSVCDVIFND